MFIILLSDANTTALITAGGLLLGIILGPLLQLIQTTIISRIDAVKERREYIRKTMQSFMKNAIILSSNLNAFVFYFENNKTLNNFNRSSQQINIEMVRNECAKLQEFLYTSVIESIFDLPKKISDTANILNQKLFEMMNYLDKQTAPMPGVIVEFPEYENKKNSVNKLIETLIKFGRKELKK